MKCEDCKYCLNLCGTIFCVSRNHKRTDKRISQEDAERDIDCKWADKEKDIVIIRNDGGYFGTVSSEIVPVYAEGEEK